jgi:alpha-ketoglutarate-dependent taurine dioxygenase
MKISKIPGLGRFGIFIDDVDFNHLSDDEWMEIGKLHLQSLVTIIRDTKLEPFEYQRRINQWGTARTLAQYRIEKKYGCWMSKFYQRVAENDPTIDEDDKRWAVSTYNMMVTHPDGSPTSMLKVSGQKNEKGDPIGMFAEGELLWHSNESGNTCFTPAVSLLAHTNTVGSSTGFVTTVDWYEQQSESFRSELDEMVIVHNFVPGKINPGLRKDQDDVMYKNMCPEDGIEIPLIINSPGGIRGLHYSVNTVGSIKGMSAEESRKIFDIIDAGVFTEQYTYDHWYKTDGDLCLFDNSITLHRRLGDITGRLCYRIQYDYETVLDQPYVPYYTDPYKSNYIRDITDVMTTLNRPRFKQPI